MADVDHEDWCICTGASFFASPEWLQSVQSTFGLDRRYLLGSTEDAAACVVYHADAAAFQFYNPLLLLIEDEALVSAQRNGLDTSKELSQAIVHLAQLEHATAAVAVCPYGPGQALTPACSPQARSRIVDAVEDASSRWGAAMTSFLYAPQSDEGLATELSSRGYIEVHGGANCVLHLPDGGFDGYLMSLSRSRRESVRREVSKFWRNGLRTKHGSIAKDLDVLAHLAASLDAKYGHSYDVEHEKKALSAIDAALNPWVNVKLTYKHDMPVGFVMYFLRDQVMYVKGTGYDYEHTTRDDHAYFNTLFYSLIKEAEHLTVRRIEYAQSSYKAKISRGCIAERLRSWIKFPDGFRASAEIVATRQRQHMEQSISCHEG